MGSYSKNFQIWKIDMKIYLKWPEICHLLPTDWVHHWGKCLSASKASITTSKMQTNVAMKNIKVKIGIKKPQI